MTKRELMADAILVLTAFIWGTGFVVMKNTVDSVPPGAIIANNVNCIITILCYYISSIKIHSIIREY